MLDEDVESAAAEATIIEDHPVEFGKFDQGDKFRLAKLRVVLKEYQRIQIGEAGRAVQRLLRCFCG